MAKKIATKNKKPMRVPAANPNFKPHRYSKADENAPKPRMRKSMTPKKKHALTGVKKSAAHKKAISEGLKAHHANRKKTAGNRTRAGSTAFLKDEKRGATSKAKVAAKKTSSKGPKEKRVQKAIDDSKAAIKTMQAQLKKPNVTDKRAAALKEQIRNSRKDIKQFKANLYG